MKKRQSVPQGGASRLLCWIVPLTILALSAGCASGARPDAYQFRKYNGTGQVDLVRGGQFSPVDVMGRYVFSMPGKLILWNWDVGSHGIDADHEQLVRNYVDLNGLYDVKVRVNEYAPVDEFVRLWTNHDVGLLYRGTVGMYFWFYDTIVPGRLFAGSFTSDHYNPYTNTVHLYSGDPAMSLRELARAKAAAQQKYRGTAAFVRLIPGVDFYQDRQATKEAQSYFYCLRNRQGEIEGYKTLYPELGTSPGQELVTLFGPVHRLAWLVVTSPVAVVGHISGQSQADKRLTTQPQDPPFGSELVVMKETQPKD